MSPPRIRRVVYLLESPLSQRDVGRFGLRTLQDAGFEVEVWDLADLYLPSAARDEQATPADVRVTTIESFDQLTRMCRTLQSEDLVMCILGVYLGQLSSHRRLLTALSASPATLGTMSAGHLPQELVVGDDSLEIESLTSARLTLRLRARALAARLRGSFLGSSTARHLVASVSMRAYRLRPLDIVWAGTTTAGINPALIGSHTIVRFIHTLDYDRIAPLIDRARQPGSGIVLIDSMGPLHPDYSLYYQSSGVPRPLRAVERYFAPLRRALDDIGRLSGEAVTIAAHPRARPGQLEEIFTGHDVVYLDTARQVAEASVVLLTGPTTALSLVTTFRKPALVVTAASFDPYLQVVLPRLSTLLHLDVWDADAAHDTWRTPAVDEAAYAGYVTRFVKREGSPTLPFWTQVARDASTWGTSGMR